MCDNRCVRRSWDNGVISVSAAGCGPTKKAAKKAAAVEVLTEMKNAGIPIKSVPIKTKKV